MVVAVVMVVVMVGNIGRQRKRNYEGANEKQNTSDRDGHKKNGRKREKREIEKRENKEKKTQRIVYKTDEVHVIPK